MRVNVRAHSYCKADMAYWATDKKEVVKEKTSGVRCFVQGWWGSAFRAAFFFFFFSPPSKTPARPVRNLE